MASPIKARCAHVAMVLHGNRILSVGMNVKRTHPFAKRVKTDRPQPTQCAELNCLLKMGYNNRDKVPDFSSYTLIVLRIKDGQTSLSRPCASCQAILKQIKMKRVLYSIEGDRLIEFEE